MTISDDRVVSRLSRRQATSCSHAAPVFHRSENQALSNGCRCASYIPSPSGTKGCGLHFAPGDFAVWMCARHPKILRVEGVRAALCARRTDGEDVRLIPQGPQGRRGTGCTLNQKARRCGGACVIPSPSGTKEYGLHSVSESFAALCRVSARDRGGVRGCCVQHIGTYKWDPSWFGSRKRQSIV